MFMDMTPYSILFILCQYKHYNETCLIKPPPYKGHSNISQNDMTLRLPLSIKSTIELLCYREVPLHYTIKYQ